MLDGQVLLDQVKVRVSGSETTPLGVMTVITFVPADAFLGTDAVSELVLWVADTCTPSTSTALPGGKPVLSRTSLLALPFTTTLTLPAPDAVLAGFKLSTMGMQSS
jgi:hypothetical protein